MHQYLDKLSQDFEPRMPTPICLYEILTTDLAADNCKITGNRQDITRFLGTWMLSQGYIKDDLEKYLIDFSTNVLCKISKSSTSRIVHSTKSLLKYIFREQVAFDCFAANNAINAPCDKNCAYYTEQTSKYLEKCEQEDAKMKSYIIDIPPVPVDPEIERRRKVKEQYQEARALVKEQHKRHVPAKRILALVTERGYTNAFGKPWNLRLVQKMMYESK